MIIVWATQEETEPFDDLIYHPWKMAIPGMIRGCPLLYEKPRVHRMFSQADRTF